MRPVILLTFVFVACAAPTTAEDRGETSSHIEGGRYDSSAAAPQQTDDWSCSVHTAAWMLHATGNTQSLETVRQEMLSTGRVTSAQGLSDASGAGLASTLREMSSGQPSVGNSGSASWDDFKAKAGKMAVGIGGRAWNHWSGVRGYDPNADVLLLANSAEGYKHVYTTLSHSQFNDLGGMSMVWLDYGSGPPPPPFKPAPRPASNPFTALLVKSTISTGNWVTQCNPEESGERVWKTNGTGPDPATYWAPAQYPQQPKNGCGTAINGTHPLVFRSLTAGSLGGAWIVQCSGYGDGAQHVFYVDSAVDGHPAASFRYEEPNPNCD